MPIEYVVKQGDCIASIAFKHGFFPETLLSAPQNENIRKKRLNLNILMKGDTIFVMDKREKFIPISAENKYRFRRKGVPDMLHLVLAEEDGTPCSRLNYCIDIDGHKRSGKTNKDGVIRHVIKPYARKARLWIEDEPEDGNLKEIYEIHLGDLNPITEESGVLMRLRNLGYYDGSVEGPIDDGVALAIEEFQEYEGLTVTGKLNDETTQRIEEKHGS